VTVLVKSSGAATHSCGAMPLMDGGGRELAGVPAEGTAECEQSADVSMGLPCCGGCCRIATCCTCREESAGGAVGGRQGDSGLACAYLRAQGGAAVAADRGGGGDRAEEGGLVRGEQSQRAAAPGERGVLRAGRSPDQGLGRGRTNAKGSTLLQGDSAAGQRQQLRGSVPVSYADDELRQWLHDEARLYEEVLGRLMPQLHLAGAYVVADLVDFEGLASFDSCFGELSACKVRKALLGRAAALAAAPASAQTPQSPCTALATPVAAVGLVRSRQLPDSIRPRALFGDDEACGGDVRQVTAAEAAAVEAEAATALQACVRGRRARLELEMRRAEEREEVRTPSLRHARGFCQALRLTHVASAVGAAAIRIVEYDGDADGPYGEHGVRHSAFGGGALGCGALRGGARNSGGHNLSCKPTGGPRLSLAPTPRIHH